jgi:hypothetical protein
MDYMGERHFGAIGGDRVGHDLDCALMTGGHLNAK